MFKLFKKWFSKPTMLEVTPTIKKTRDDLIKEVNLSIFKQPDITNVDKNITILILDDIPESITLYNSDFLRIGKRYNKNILEDLKIVYTIGRPAGYIAYKYIIEHPNTINYAILDITLGYIIKLEDGEYIELDGIDIAIYLLRYNTNIKFLFSTAHTLNRRNPTMEYYFNKFESETGLNIEDYYLNKNSDRAEKIYNMIYGDTL